MDATQKAAELAKLTWTLKDGSTPMRRIYSTVKHLGSKLSYTEVEQLVNSQVKAGNILAEPHPFNHGEYFYSLPHKE